MAVIVEKKVGEPIIMLKPDAQVSMQELIDAWFRSTELAQTIDGTPYRIVDLRSTNAPEMVISLIRNFVRGLIEAPVDPVMKVCFVGTPSKVSAAANKQAEAWFESLEAALKHIRAAAGVPTVSSS